MSNTQMKPIVAGTQEILSAILSNILTAETAADFKADPAMLISERLGCSINPAGDYRVVENSDKEINLILPYYTIVEEKKAKAMSDKEAANVSAAGSDADWYNNAFNLGVQHGEKAVNDANYSAGWNVGVPWGATDGWSQGHRIAQGNLDQIRADARAQAQQDILHEMFMASIANRGW